MAGPLCAEMNDASLGADGVPVSRVPGVEELYCSWNATSPRLVVRKSPYPLRRAFSHVAAQIIITALKKDIQ